MSKRQLNNWIESYLEYTKETESPTLFHLWSGFSVISSALGRKCFMSRGFYNCYPNQYIVLVAGSALCRKTTASDIAINIYKNMLNIVDGIPVLSGKMTARALADELYKIYDRTGTSSVYIYSPELMNLLGADSYASGLEGWLTTLWDCPSEKEWITATCGSSTNKNVFINILGCTTFNHIQNLPDGAMERGLTSRMIYIVQDKPSKPNACPEKTEKLQKMEEALTFDLIQIANMEGEFVWGLKAKEVFVKWYNKFFYEERTDTRLDPYYGRKGETIIKVAMWLSAARSDNMIIEKEDVNKSLKYLEEVEILMPAAYSSLSFSDNIKQINTIIGVIKKYGTKGGISRSMLTKKMSYWLKSKPLYEVVNDMMEMETLKMKFKDGKPWYYLTGN